MTRFQRPRSSGKAPSGANVSTSAQVMSQYLLRPASYTFHRQFVFDVHGFETSLSETGDQKFPGQKPTTDKQNSGQKMLTRRNSLSALPLQPHSHSKQLPPRRNSLAAFPSFAQWDCGAEGMELGATCSQSRPQSAKVSQSRPALRLKQAFEESESSRQSMSKVAEKAAWQKKIVTALRRIPCLADIGEMELSMLAITGVPRRIGRYRLLYREGVVGRTFFVLTQGWIKHVDHNGHSFTQSAENLNFVVLGDEAFVSSPRRTTASALSTSDVLQFTLIEGESEQALSISRRLFHQFVRNQLSATPIFAGLESLSLHQVVTLFSLAEIEAEQVIFSEGGPADSFYILLHGRVQVSQGGATIAYLDARDLTCISSGPPFFGEMALLDDKVRMATVASTTPCKLFVLRWIDFPTFLNCVPNFKERVRRVHSLRKSAAQAGIQQAFP